VKETLTQRVKRLEEIVDVLLLVTAGHLSVSRDRKRANDASGAIQKYVEDPTRENYIDALAAIKETMS
jgi:hypothetical protein